MDHEETARRFDHAPDDGFDLQIVHETSSYRASCNVLSVL